MTADHILEETDLNHQAEAIFSRSQSESAIVERWRKRRLILLALQSLVVLVVAIGAFYVLPAMALYIVPVAGLALYILFRRANKIYRTAAREKLMATLARPIGLSYFRDGILYPSHLQMHGLLPDHESCISNDHFKGSIDGIKIEFGALHLHGNHHEKLYNTVAILMALPQEFEGHTMLLPKTENAAPEKLESVTITNSALAENYQGFSNDPQEAAPLLGSSFIAALKDLCDNIDADSMRVSFMENEIAILLPESKREFFDIGTIFTPLPKGSAKTTANEILHIVNLAKAAKDFSG